MLSFSLSFSWEKLGPSISVPFWILNSGIVKRISGGSMGGAQGTWYPRPLFLDQSEARRAEKNFGDTPPSPSAPYLKFWIRH